MRFISVVSILAFMIHFLSLGSLAQAQSPVEWQECVSSEDIADPRPMSFEYFEGSDKTEYEAGDLYTVHQHRPVANVTVEGSSVQAAIGTQIPKGVFLSVCLTVENLDDSKMVFSRYFPLYQAGQETPLLVHQLATTSANGISEAEARQGLQTATDGGPFVQIPKHESDNWVLVFDVDPDEPSLFLSSSTAGEDGLLPMMPIPTSESAVQTAVAEKSDLAASGAPQTTNTSGQVTNFDEETLIHVGMPKWIVTFDSRVEVRSQIAGVYPQNGQFLVMWFDQKSQNGDPMLLGNFQLIASAGEGGDARKIPLSRDGTAALIQTEYDWSSINLDPSRAYRTGIVFDIAPAETHFLLEYDLGMANEGWGPRKPIFIRFVA